MLITIDPCLFFSVREREDINITLFPVLQAQITSGVRDRNPPVSHQKYSSLDNNG